MLVVQGHPQFRVMSVERFFFFSDFSPSFKKSEVCRESECEAGGRVQLMDAGGL